MKRQQILAAIAAHAPQRFEAEGLREAAVLVPLRPEAGDPDSLELILTRRTTDLTAHAGQVAFPGGHVEQADPSPEAAALREAQEELGIPPYAVTVVGRLDEMQTHTGFHITPVVGVVSRDATFQPDPREVARVFTVPMRLLLDPAGWELRPYRRPEGTFQIWHFPYDGEDIWGVTGHMLRGFVELLWASAEPARGAGRAAE